MKTCAQCQARLPARFFPVIAGRVSRRCAPCLNTARRLRDPLPELRRNRMQVLLNNTTNTWFGPVRREPFRSHA